MGDRFGHQGKAQLRACVLATETGAQFGGNPGLEQVETAGSIPSSAPSRPVCAPKPTRPVKGPRLETILPRGCGPHPAQKRWIVSSLRRIFHDRRRGGQHIGKPAGVTEVKAFVERHPELIGTVIIPHIDQPFAITRAEVERVAKQSFCSRRRMPEKFTRHIVSAKGAEKFHHRSFDGRDRDSPQTPPELLIASWPRLPTRKSPSRPSRRSSPARGSTKGVDYVGDVKQFEKGIQRRPGPSSRLPSRNMACRHRSNSACIPAATSFHLRADASRR